MKENGFSGLECSYYQTIFMEFVMANGSKTFSIPIKMFKFRVCLKDSACAKESSLLNGFRPGKILTLIVQT